VTERDSSAEELRRLALERLRTAERVRNVTAAEGHQTGGQSGTLRAAIFGINDGLVSNFSLVMGVAGADPGSRFVLLAGMAGLLAGAFSMAAGEYVSMSSQRELFENQIAVERRKHEEDPEGERRELALMCQSRGIPEAEAWAMADTLMRDPEVALDIHVRQELGLNPEELGSPWGAAFSSFGAFVVGAIVPVAPYLLSAGTAALILSVVFSALALLGTGAAISAFTIRHWLSSGLRMLFIGALAATVTYLVGSVIGVSAGL
jgi:VIT1/CCC1 family predicted Fe2+/Mn2+ transporter